MAEATESESGTDRESARSAFSAALTSLCRVSARDRSWVGSDRNRATSLGCLLRKSAKPEDAPSTRVNRILAARSRSTNPARATEARESTVCDILRTTVTPAWPCTERGALQDLQVTAQLKWRDLCTVVVPF